jgi:hypothetical protein
MVTFGIQYTQTESISCRTQAFNNRAQAEEAKSKLEQAEGVSVWRVERV